jgi:hypothetical protein
VIHNARLLDSLVQLVGESGISKTDFKVAAGLKREFGLGLNDHTRGLNDLLDKGVIIEQEGRYLRGTLNLDVWTPEEIQEGNGGLELLADFPGFQGRKKFRDGLNEEIGLIGELYVVTLLREQVDPDLAHQIDHVSLVNDMAGYDIRSPGTTSVWDEVFLEVKTTTRADTDAVFYLTRNESNVGAKARNWFLVFVSLSEEGPSLRGHLPFSEVSPLLPENKLGGMVWSETVGKIPLEDLYSGLP